jgi:hypothetical protein
MIPVELVVEFKGGGKALGGIELFFICKLSHSKDAIVSRFK